MDLDKLKQDYANYLILTSSLTVVGCANVLKAQASKAIDEMSDEQCEELDNQLNPPAEEENLDGNPDE